MFNADRRFSFGPLPIEAGRLGPSTVRPRAAPPATPRTPPAAPRSTTPPPPPSAEETRGGTAAIVAILALGGVLAAVAIICAPWWRWRFVASAKSLSEAVRLGHSLDSMRRHLAADFEAWLDGNERPLRGLQLCFTPRPVLPPGQLVAWLVQIAALRG